MAGSGLSLSRAGLTALLLLATAVTGCGQASRLNAPGPRSEAVQTKRTGYAVRWAPRPKVRNLSAPLPTSGAAIALENDGDAPAPPAAGPGNGLRPLPRPTPTPPPAAPAPPRAPDEVDALLTILQNFGYNGDRRQMVRALQACLFAYPVNTPATPGGWDPTINPREHYEWWKKTLPPEETGSFNDYMQQSLLIAQNKFDVVYYVWISKQYNPEQMKREGRSSPFIDLNEQIPVVKGIAGGGWLAQIAPNATIHDYLKIPEQYLRDYNHLVRIPESLYF